MTSKRMANFSIIMLSSLFFVTADAFSADGHNPTEIQEVTLLDHNERPRIHYDQEQIIAPVSTSRALWAQINFGSAAANINYAYHPKDFIQVELGGHFRRNQMVFSAGYDHVTDAECWGINNYWGACGYSFYEKWLEFTLSAGLGATQWYYYTESELGTLRSDVVPALRLNTQLILHLPQVIGTGVAFTCSFSQEATYTGLLLVFALGAWNW